MSAMDFGVFVEQMRHGNSQAEAFREMFALVDAAEAWGLDVVWLAEMLINPARSVLSAPLLVASTVVGRTKRLRTGTAVQLLPLNHPLRVAGEVTTLDHLSQGRFDFGIGRSGSPRAYDALGVPYEESQERFFEALRSSSPRGRASPSATRADSTGSPTPPWRRSRTGGRIRPCGWPPRRRRRFPASAGWDCRSSSASAAWTSRS
jgi:Luciferase-like monooxygenase